MLLVYELGNGVNYEPILNGYEIYHCFNNARAKEEYKHYYNFKQFEGIIIGVYIVTDWK